MGSRRATLAELVIHRLGSAIKRAQGVLRRTVWLAFLDTVRTERFNDILGLRRVPTLVAASRRLLCCSGTLAGDIEAPPHGEELGR